MSSAALPTYVLLQFHIHFLGLLYQLSHKSSIVSSVVHRDAHDLSQWYPKLIQGLQKFRALVCSSMVTSQMNKIEQQWLLLPILCNPMSTQSKEGMANLRSPHILSKWDLAFNVLHEIRKNLTSATFIFRACSGKSNIPSHIRRGTGFYLKYFLQIGLL